MHLSLFAALGWIGWLADPANWLTVLAVAAGLGFVIFVHELGHFLVAKACGVKCEKFYLGFDIYGLKLFKFQWGETEYGIGVLPLGGYVKMLGQDDNPARMAEETRRSQAKAGGASADAIATAEHAPAMTHGDLPPEPVSDPHAPYDPRSYMAQSVPKRMAIISAGVIMNVIFAFLMASLAYGLGVNETPCIVGRVTAGGGAWKADLQPGDEVIKIGNLENPRYRDLQTRVPVSDAKNGIEFVIKRPNVEEPLNITLYPNNAIGVPLVGITPSAQLRLGEELPAHPDSAAAAAKPPLKPNDRISKINGQEVTDYRELQKSLLPRVNETIRVTVLRPPAKLYESLKESKEEKLTPAEIERQLDAASESVEVEIAPTPVRDVGLEMTMGPITAVQTGSPAEKAGIKSGDLIVSLDGKSIGNPLTLPIRLAAIAKEDGTVKLEVERNVDGKKELIPIAIKPRTPEWHYPINLMFDPVSADAIGVAYEVIAKVVKVLPDSPAAKADIVPGDKITKFQFIYPKDAKNQVADDDKQDAQQKDKIDKRDTKEKAPKKDSDVYDIDEKSQAWPFLIFDGLTGADPQMKVKLWVERGDKEHEVELSPTIAKLEDGSDWNVQDRGFGLKSVTFKQIAQSVGEAFQLGGRETIDNLLLVYRFLQRIGRKDGISVKMMSGPVGIAQAAGMKVKEGFASFLLFLTMLSANLAVVNFLPIPVLDGGHMVFLAYEGIRGKPASERVVIAFTYAGLIFLLTLMLFVLSLDLGWISRR
jgi:regulator of sigma E protease